MCGNIYIVGNGLQVGGEQTMRVNPIWAVSVLWTTRVNLILATRAIIPVSWSHPRLHSLPNDDSSNPTKRRDKSKHTPPPPPAKWSAYVRIRAMRPQPARAFTSSLGFLYHDIPAVGTCYLGTPVPTNVTVPLFVTARSENRLEESSDETPNDKKVMVYIFTRRWWESTHSRRTFEELIRVCTKKDEWVSECRKLPMDYWSTIITYLIHMQQQQQALDGGASCQDWRWFIVLIMSK